VNGPAQWAAGGAITLGVLADTHIPDRLAALHPQILPVFRAAGVQAILHAGDICARAVLDELEQVAPVTAVRGNRDVLAGPLHMTEQVTVGGARIALLHGHFGLIPYLVDKWFFWRDGYRLERYLAGLEQAGKHADAVVFGHTHYPEAFRRDGRFFMNPGSASFGAPGRSRQPSVGLLHIAPGGQVDGEIVPLEGYRLEAREWVQNRP
jgi:putative phosphoesterase